MLALRKKRFSCLYTPNLLPKQYFGSFRINIVFEFFFQLQAQLSAILIDSQTPLEVLVFTAISLGLVFVGSCNEEVAQSIIFVLMDRSEAELAEPIVRLLPVALGLLYLGKQVCFFP
jgi:hypothetical protein